MRLEVLTEHQKHLFGEIIILAIQFWGILGLVIYLDRRGVKPYPPGKAETALRTAPRDKSIKFKKTKKIAVIIMSESEFAQLTVTDYARKELSLPLTDAGGLPLSTCTNLTE